VTAGTTERHGHKWNAETCDQGHELVGCHGCCELRCLTCDPYTDYERLNRCCTVYVYEPRDLAMQTLDGTLPYEETWCENATNVLHLLNEVERLRGERFDTSNVQIRDLGRLAVEGLTVMRDEDDDEWALPDLQTINRAIAAVSALVSHAEDRQRFKRALRRIADENTSSDGFQEYARSVLAGGSARVPLAKASTESLESNALAEKEGFEPSFPAKSHRNRLGLPSDPSEHA
jgi:hypothetical protein